MPVDKWGLPFLYPSKPSGFFWEQLDDITKDSHFNPEGITSSGGGSFTVHFSGPTSPDIFSDPAFANTNSIGGCGMDFAATVKRGYIYKPNDPRDVELKMILNFQNGFSSDGFSISGNTGKHSGSGCCSGFDYMLNIQPGSNPSTFRFRKEMWHVDYITDPVTGEDWTHPSVNFKLEGHGNVGLCYVRYNKKDGAIGTGHNTNDSVIIEAWFNPDPDNNPLNWIMLKRTEDKGGWGSSGDKCGGDKDQIGTWAGPKYRIKSNASSANITFKHLSLREIDPTLSFTDNPDNPPPPDQPGTSTELQGIFEFRNDINNVRDTSQCAGAGAGGGGGSGNTTFYDEAATNDKELSDSSTFQHRTGVLEGCDNSSSVMFGKKLIQLDVPLKKVGSPSASPTVGAKILDSTGATVYTSPTTFDPSTFTTSFVYKTFDFSGNTHTFITGDYVGVFWTGTSSTDYVKCGYTDADEVLNTTYYNYESGTFDPKSREFGCRMWQ